MAIKIDQVKKGNLTVVMYHYVREIVNSQFPNIKGLELQAFIEQIKYFNKHYNFVTIEQVIDSINNNSPLPPKSILLTFDDGYKDHYSNVLPVLIEHKIKGCFYVPAIPIIEKKILDVNKIHFILAQVGENINSLVSDLREALFINKNEYNLQDFEFYYKKLAMANRFDAPEVIFVKRLLQVELTETLRAKITDALFNKYIHIEEEEFAENLYLSKKEISEMLNEGMHIGCHGYNHYWWNKLKENELENEIDKSIEFLRDLGVNTENWTAAYPYGSYSLGVERMLKEKKCKLAFTTEVGIATCSGMQRLLMERLDTNDLPRKINSGVNLWYDRAK
jgi:peptidoglycan/xylan/chitin deacetylase (PgdA/CDA1 family)